MQHFVVFAEFNPLPRPVAEVVAAFPGGAVAIGGSSAEAGGTARNFSSRAARFMMAFLVDSAARTGRSVALAQTV